MMNFIMTPADCGLATYRCYGKFATCHKGQRRLCKQNAGRFPIILTSDLRRLCELQPWLSSVLSRTGNRLNRGLILRGTNKVCVRVRRSPIIRSGSTLGAFFATKTGIAGSPSPCPSNSRRLCTDMIAQTDTTTRAPTNSYDQLVACHSYKIEQFVRLLLCSCILSITICSTSIAAESAWQDEVSDTDLRAAIYSSTVKPVLAERCFACHGALKQEAGLRVDTVAAMVDAGVLSLGDAEGSELFERVTSSDEFYRMPPEGHALKDDELNAMRQWIDDGAVAPRDEQPEPDPTAHWSFLSPTKVDLGDGPDGQSLLELGPADRFRSTASSNAESTSASEPRHPIDALLEMTRQERGVAAIAEASREQSLRRLYLDLIGLPPQPAQVDRYLDDSRNDAWERVVDELLASPRYGERWGRHWMDVWRYSDGYGLGEQLRHSQKHLWHWRDWIVESLNDDVGYDRMLELMLAADEIKPTDREIKL